MSLQQIPKAETDLVFVCGALRSGTTLLRLMINHHPLLDNPGEMDFLFEGPDDESVNALAHYRREVSFNRVFRSTGLRIDDALSYPDLIRSFLSQLRRPGKRLSINIHRNFHRIPAIFPDARYVHLLRDPRDVAKSAIGMGWAGNVFHGVDHWIFSERDFEELSRQVQPQQIHTLKNEDLIVDPRGALTALCEFLGVDFDAAMLDYPAHTTYSAPDPSLTEQWKRNLSAREIALVESKVAPMLAPRGYAASGGAMLAPNGFEKFRLRQENRLGRVRFSIRRYGAGLTLAALLSRIVPVGGFREAVQRRVEKKMIAHLK
ncbi:MAG: sulfotransferase [Parvularculaceae bacterium]|nr:sulfotransferase [Parvularculaceae bacterium]